MRVEFDKMEGAGNDFILIDNRRGLVPDEAKVGLVKNYCRRCYGIGADGMIFIQNDPEFAFAWDFYNSDGSPAEMCGNGARCAARFANKIGVADDRMTFRSLAGPIKAEITDRGARVQLTDAVLPTGFDTLNISEDFVQVWSVNTGVPHAVVKVPDLEKVDVREVGRLLRYHAHFAPSGTNVNFFSPKGGGRLAIRTYERGVEDETLACGTGSVATSIVAGIVAEMISPITVETRGGDELVVYFRIDGEKAVDVSLEGDARLVFSGEFEA